MRTKLFFLAAVWLILIMAVAFAHDHGRPELNRWFKDLHASNGVACCDGSDATSLDDVDWDTKDDHYRVRIEGQWIDVPDEAVIKEPNKAGQAMVWPYYSGGLIVVRCFIPGVET